MFDLRGITTSCKSASLLDTRWSSTYTVNVISSLIFSLLIAQAPHPLFDLDVEKLKSSYEQGRTDFKKKVRFESILDPWDIDVGKVRSPEGQSWKAPCALLLPPALMARWEGFEDARHYQGPEQFNENISRILEAQKNPQLSQRRIYLKVILFSWPGISDWDNSINRAANQAEVKDVRFVLLPDGNVEKPIHPAVKPSVSGETVFDGSIAIPEINTVNAQTTTFGTVTGGGQTVNVRTSGSSTVTYVTHTVQGFSAYQASYDLEFPLFDKDGQPYFSQGAKKLVLKIVRPSGEHTGTWDLAALMKRL